MAKRFYITTPIYYVNAEPHIGTAYTTIAADVIARYKRMQGYEVFFLTGTDEHGQKIARAAQEKGLSPKALADQLVPRFKQTWQLLNITNDYFIRTTDPQHENTVRSLFQTISQKGDIYKGKYQGWYCTPCERYLLAGESPLPDGTSLASGGDKICPMCQRPTEYIEEPNYFFRLSRYQQPFLKYLEQHPDFIQPRMRYNEIKNRVANQLDDVSISRASFDWGVSLPDDPSQVIWVWFDALINYISAIGYGQDPERFQQFWPADVHFIAKDILWFHTVIWTAMLMSAGLEPPRQVFAHGWWTMNLDKISKSKGNVIRPDDVINKVGVDGLRYFMLREVTFGLDGDFSYDALLRRYNNELGNDLGNLLMRTLTMVDKYFNSRVPAPAEPDPRAEDLRKLVTGLAKVVQTELERYQFSSALEKIWGVVKSANKYIEESKPWVLAKEKSKRLDTVLYTLLEVIRITAVYLAPFMPETAEKIMHQLGMTKDKVDSSNKEVSAQLRLPDATRWGITKAGMLVTKSKPLFPRVE